MSQIKPINMICFHIQDVARLSIYVCEIWLDQMTDQEIDDYAMQLQGAKMLAAA